VSVPERQRSGGPRRPSPAVRRPSASPRERRLAEVGVLAAVGIWSANFVVVKSGIEALGPLTFTSIRYLIATVTLFVLVRWRLGPVRPPARVALTLMGLGMMGFGAYQVLWTLGLTQITAGDSALIIAASPVLTVLLAGAVGMDRLTAPKVAGALVAFTGVAVVVAAGHELSLGASLAGDLLTLGAAVLWAIYTVAGTGMLRRVDPLQATAWAVFGGTLFLLPFGAWNLATSPPSAVPAGAVVGLVYSGMFAAAIANVLVFNAIRLAGPARVTVSQFLVPAGAVVLGAVLLSEAVGVAQVVGGIVIVLGVWLTRRPTVLPAGMRARAASGG
jgi:drug/metabolite transporter (DMT)-like permease